MIHSLGSILLAGYHEAGIVQRAIRSRLDFPNHRLLQIDEQVARHDFPGFCVREEGHHVVVDFLLVDQPAIVGDSVLQREKFPSRRADLDASLSNMERKYFTLQFRGKRRSDQVSSKRWILTIFNDNKNTQLF